MNREEIERRLDDLLDEIKLLKEKLEEVEDEPEIPDIPEQFDSPVVWAMDSKLDVFYYGISPYNESSFNAFHTADYAHEFRRRCLMIAMMLHCKWYLCRDFIPKWSPESADKFVIYYDHNYNLFKVDKVYTFENTNVCFDTEDNAQKCADWMNAHWK